MNFISSEFIKSSTNKENMLYDEKGQIALVGRSNVGKSTFINTFLNRKNLAHTSQTPGKTQTINYYLINDLFYLVDLPGYGYSALSKKMKSTLPQMIFEYVKASINLKAIFLLLDSRHEPTKDDIEMYNFLSKKYPVYLVLTKVDKISKNSYLHTQKTIKNSLGISTDTKLFLTSSLNKIGFDELREVVENLVEGN